MKTIGKWANDPQALKNQSNQIKLKIGRETKFCTKNLKKKGLNTWKQYENGLMTHKSSLDTEKLKVVVLSWKSVRIWIRIWGLRKLGFQNSKTMEKWAADPQNWPRAPKNESIPIGLRIDIVNNQSTRISEIMVLQLENNGKTD